jgi:threonine/homoserine/homoserine lactone efflux protein
VLTNTKTIAESFGAPSSAVIAIAAVVFVAWVSLIVWAVRQERIARALEHEVETVPA